MKKFLFKLSVFVLIVLVILLVYNGIYNELRSDDMYGDGKFVHVPYDITISNVGSSHGVYAFDYQYIDEDQTGFNFALVSQTLSYDYRVICEFKDHFKEGGIMFIPVSYPSFSLDETAGEDFESKNNRYYRFLSPANIKEFHVDRYIGLHFFPAIYESTADVIKIFIKGVLNKRPIIEDADYVVAREIDFAEDARRAYQRHYNVNEDGEVIINRDEIDALYNIIDFCRARSIRPVLISTPLRDEYTSLYSQNQLECFNQIVNQVIDETGCEYYDYTHDERFATSDQYMRNADHLSPDGARAFTGIIIEEVVDAKRDAQE